MLDARITLDGRQFHGPTHALTANQDEYVTTQLRLAGVLEVMRQKDMTAEERAEKTLTLIMDTGRTFRVLAGMLTEEGKKWSRESAELNAARFGEITDNKEKLLMREYVVEFVAVFFSFVGSSSATSPKSSSRRGTVPRRKSAVHRS
jgi:hypothetical protein